MANLNNLRVSEVSDLRRDAQMFQGHAEDIKSTTDRMLELIESTNAMWRGEARTKYATQFSGLSRAMSVIFDMCMEYSTDLQEIASNYESAEESNAATAAALKSDVELRM